MKKFLICIACLMAAVIIIPSAIWLLEPKEEPNSPPPYAVMVDGQLYCSYKLNWKDGITVEEERLDGYLTLSDHGQWPTEDGQCNFAIGDDAAYMNLNGSLLIRNYDQWTILEPYYYDPD